MYKQWQLPSNANQKHFFPFLLDRQWKCVGRTTLNNISLAIWWCGSLGGWTRVIGTCRGDDVRWNENICVNCLATRASEWSMYINGATFQGLWEIWRFFFKRKFSESPKYGTAELLADKLAAKHRFAIVAMLLVSWLLFTPPSGLDLIFSGQNITCHAWKLPNVRWIWIWIDIMNTPLKKKLLLPKWLNEPHEQQLTFIMTTSVFTKQHACIAAMKSIHN